MAKPSWIHVRGPCGRDTTIQLTPTWRAALKKRAGRKWTADYTVAAVKAAAAHLVSVGHDALRDGSFSAAVRRRAYELAQ